MQLTTTLLPLSLYANGTAAASSDGVAAVAFAASLVANATFRAATLNPVLQVRMLASASVRA
jgi:hypothetical protein